MAQWSLHCHQEEWKGAGEARKNEKQRDFSDIEDFIPFWLWDVCLFVLFFVLTFAFVCLIAYIDLFHCVWGGMAGMMGKRGGGAEGERVWGSWCETPKESIKSHYKNSFFLNFENSFYFARQLLKTPLYRTPNSFPLVSIGQKSRFYTSGSHQVVSRIPS